MKPILRRLHLQIVRFTLKKKENIKCFETEVGPSEYDIVNNIMTNEGYDITAVFLKKDMNDLQLSRKVKALYDILISEGNSEVEAAEMTDDLRLRYIRAIYGRKRP
jgi:hypothetical protein